MRFLAPTSDWIRTSTLSATSEQVGYEAPNAATDDPSEPWWANSGTATLTVTFGATRSVDVVALIMTNADDGETITVTIDGTPHTLTGARTPNGDPIDLVLVLPTPVSVTGFTVAIAGNSVNWSIGRVAAGLSGTLARSFLNGFVPEPFRVQFSDESHLGHDIRYDCGVDGWKLSGEVILSVAEIETAEAWWRSTRGGFYPTLVVVDEDLYPPMWMRLPPRLPRTVNEGGLAVTLPLTLTSVARGEEPA